MRRSRQPVALTVAGSDSGGGAGIQADLKTFASLEVHGASVITCLTAQNPQAVLGIQACRSEMVRQQLTAVFAELPPAAAKTGMLLSTEIIGAVSRFFRAHRSVPLIVDPVMVATSGARLLKPAAVRSLLEQMLPLATLVTPNLDEAQIIAGHPVTTPAEARAAAREIQARYGCATLVKGGHLTGLREAVDFYFDGQEEWMLKSPFIRGVSTHGTGCTYSAAITGYLALGCELASAVRLAKEYILQAITQSRRIGAHTTLNHFWTA